jgi:hypothetical protein
MTLARYTVRDLVRIVATHEVILGLGGWPAQLAAITDELERRCGEGPGQPSAEDAMEDLSDGT